MSYLEERAGFTRRGKGGHSVEAAKIIFATFEHGTSRAQDPQLHTHALLVNVCVRTDGTTGSIVSKEFFVRKMEAGALYRAELAHQLHTKLGLKIENTADAFKITGVPSKLCKRFSKRRVEIQHELSRRGLSSTVAAMIAALDTRSSKDLVPRSKLFAVWREKGREFGWSDPEAKRLISSLRHACVQLLRCFGCRGPSFYRVCLVYGPT